MRRSPILATAVAALAVAAVASAGPASAATGGCHQVSGGFVASSPPTCAGIFCTVGRLSGDLDASYSFVGYAFAPDGGLLGHSTIGLTNGAVITSNDESVLYGPPLPGTQFITTVNFAGGTREFTHVSGGLVAPGTITDTGTVGTYSGQYCLANKAK
jgi:hypothetical protein